MIPNGSRKKGVYPFNNFNGECSCFIGEISTLNSESRKSISNSKQSLAPRSACGEVILNHGKLLCIIAVL